MSDKCLFDRPLDIKNELASRRCQNLYVAAVGSQNELVNSPWNNELHKDGGKCNRSSITASEKLASARCSVPDLAMATTNSATPRKNTNIAIRLNFLLCSARTLLMLAI